VRTIVHLSDLHFGRIDPTLPPALLRAVVEAAPDLVVISGDLTQRARTAEFKAAARFLEILPTPKLTVPGNHDVPLYNVLRRWLSPLGRYRRYITNDLAPFYQDAEIAALGVNTARAMTFKDGRINRLQIEAGMQRLAHCGKDVTRIVVTVRHARPHPGGGSGAQCCRPSRHGHGRIYQRRRRYDPVRPPAYKWHWRDDETLPATRPSGAADPGGHCDIDTSAWRGQCIQCRAHLRARSGGPVQGVATR
jgi:3',5'-cyclic AMP phosphodiesterase CpdA